MKKYSITTENFVDLYGEDYEVEEFQHFKEWQDFIQRSPENKKIELTEESLKAMYSLGDSRKEYGDFKVWQKFLLQDKSNVGAWGHFRNWLERVFKRTFKFKNFPSDCALRCKTEVQAQTYCKYMNSIGERWSNGGYYKDTTNWNFYGEHTVYEPRRNLFSSYGAAFGEDFKILEFTDFNWKFPRRK